MLSCRSLILHCSHVPIYPHFVYVKVVATCQLYKAQVKLAICIWFLFLFAHLSIGELIVYPWSSVGRRPSSVGPSVRRPQCSDIIIFSETARPIKAKFYVEPPWVRGMEFCSQHVGHMTKMAARPIYGKNPSKIFSGTGGPISMKIYM